MRKVPTRFRFEQRGQAIEHVPVRYRTVPPHSIQLKWLYIFAAAVRNAIARGAIGFDAVKHLVLCHIERRPPRLDMTVYPYLPQPHVAMTSAKTYLGLLTGAAL